MDFCRCSIIYVRFIPISLDYHKIMFNSCYFLSIFNNFSLASMDFFGNSATSCPFHKILIDFCRFLSKSCRCLLVFIYLDTIPIDFLGYLRMNAKRAPQLEDWNRYWLVHLWRMPSCHRLLERVLTILARFAERKHWSWAYCHNFWTGTTTRISAVWLKSIVSLQRLWRYDKNIWFFFSCLLSPGL